MNILDKIGVKSQRTKNISKHVLLSFFYKGGSIIGSFLLVPITISYLNTENYGIWLVITSFVSWFQFFDIGLGHGLRNKFAEAKAQNNIKLAKAYISTTYFAIAFISLGLFLLFFIANYFINWTFVFNANDDIGRKLSVIMLFVFGSFTIQLVAKLITTIYSADQKPSVQGLLGLITQYTTLISIFLLTKYAQTDLLLFAIIYTSIPVIALLFLNLYSFNSTYKKYKPTLALFKTEYLKSVMSLGVKFFIIQFGVMILYSTDNMIITQLFGPERVTDYSIAYKYFGVITMGYTILITPYWSAITDAYTKGEFNWIKKSISSLNKFSILFTFIAIGLLLFSKEFYLLWIGDKIDISFNLSFFMFVYVVVRVFAHPYYFFVNGTGKIHIQLYLTIFGALINIPLSILLAQKLNLGLQGVIIATIFSDVIMFVFLRIQYNKVINKKAKGIWNK